MNDTEKKAILDFISVAINEYIEAVKEFEHKLKPGFHRRRSGYDQLIENGLLKPKTIFTEYPLICEKRSTLSASMRVVISAIGDRAKWLYLDEKRKQEQKPKQ